MRTIGFEAKRKDRKATQTKAADKVKATIKRKAPVPPFGTVSGEPKVSDPNESAPATVRFCSVTVVGGLA